MGKFTQMQGFFLNVRVTPSLHVTRVEITSTPWVRGQITFREPCFYDNPVTITISTRGTRVEIELSPLEKVCLGPDPPLTFWFSEKENH